MEPTLILFSSSGLGGAERSLSRMAMAVPSDSYILATMDGEGPWTEWIRNCGPQPLVFGKRKPGEVYGHFGPSTIWRLFRWIRKSRVKRIYVCGLRATLAIRLAKPFLGGVRLIQGVRWNPNSSSDLDKIFRVIERWLNWQVDFYITNSNAAAKTLNKDCGISNDRIAVIYNGVEAPVELVNKNKNRSSPPLVLTVANYASRKGYIEYLSAIEAVLNKRPDTQFALVGRDDMNGQLQEEILRRQLSSAVTCVGFKPDISPLLHQASVFVLPSLRNEGCPTSILEALAHRVPVAAYSLDGIPEIIDHGTDGLLAPVGNTDILANNILYLLDNPDEALRMGEAGRDKVLKQFSIDFCAGEHRRVWDKL